MANNTSDNPAITGTNHAYFLSPLALEAKIENSQIVKKELDSIAQAKTQEKNTKSTLDRPALPAATSKNPNFLALLSAAFTKVYGVMEKTLTGQIGDFSKLQELNETTSQMIRQSTFLAVDKEQKAADSAKSLENEQKKLAHQNKQLNSFTQFAGFALIAATIALGFMTDGAADAALPEEEAALTAAETSGAVDLGEEAGTENLAEVNTSEDTSGASTSSASTSMTTSGESTSSAENASRIAREQERTSEDLEASDNQNAKSQAKEKKEGTKLSKTSKALKILGKGAWGAGVSAILSLPQLIQGLEAPKLASRETQLAKTQADVGAAMATVGKNNAYFQFYQQLVQQKTSLLSELADGLSTVLKTYGDVTNAFQQISYGFARIV